MKAQPSGIATLQPGDTIPLDIPELAHAYIDGARFRLGLGNVYPTNSTPIWTGGVDAVIGVCASYSKFAGMNIAAGIDTPTWYYDTCRSYTISLDDSGAGGMKMPIPWDAPFLSLFTTHIAAFGARHDGTASLRYVVVCGFMQLAINNLTKTQADYDAMNAIAISDGFTGLYDAYLYAAKLIIDAYAAAFPTTSLILTVSRPFSNASSTVNALGLRASTQIKNYGISKYPDHFGTMVTDRQATPGPWTRTMLPSYPHISQAIYASSQANLAGYYLPPPPSPIPDSPQPLIDMGGNSYQSGDKMIELYGGDCTSADAGIIAAIISTRALLLS